MKSQNNDSNSKVISITVIIMGFKKQLWLKNFKDTKSGLEGIKC